MASDLKREDILNEIKRLRAEGVPRKEIARRIVANAKAYVGREKTPREAGVEAHPPNPYLDETVATQARLVEEGRPSLDLQPGPKVAPQPNLNSLAAIPGAAGARQPQPPAPPQPSMGPPQPSRAPGTSIGPRPKTLGERTEDIGTFLGDEFLRLAGYDPATLEQHPEAMFLAPASVLGQTLAAEATGSVVGSAGSRLLKSAQMLEMAKAHPLVGRLLGLFTRNEGKLLSKVGSTGAFSLSQGAIDAAKDRSLASGARSAAETAAFLGAFDMALVGTGRALGMAADSAPVQAIRKGVSEGISTAFRSIENWAQKNARPLTDGERQSIAAFLTRVAVDKMRGYTSEQFEAEFKRQLTRHLDGLGAVENMVGQMGTARAAAEEASREFNKTFERSLRQRLDRIVKMRPEHLVPPEGSLTELPPPVPSAKPSPADVAQKREVLLHQGRGDVSAEAAIDEIAADRRGQSSTRARYVMKNILDATNEEAGKLTGAQVQEIAALPAPEAKARGEEILGQIRKGASTPARRPLPPGTSRAQFERLRAARREAASKEAEAKVVRESAPKRDFTQMLDPEEALDEIAKDPVGRMPIDFGRGHSTPPPGPVDDFTVLRQAAEREGLRLRAEEIPRPGEKQPDMLYTASDTTGKPLFSASRLPDFAAEVNKRLQNKHLVLAEPMGELAFADDSNDDEDTRKWKMVARNMWRAGTIGALLGTTASTPAPMRAWSRVAARTREIAGRALDAIGDDGLKRRLAGEWRDLKSGLANVYFSARNPEELFRHHPVLGPAVTKLASAKRALDYAWNDLRAFALTDAKRAGLGMESDAARHAGAILDGVDSDMIRGIKDTTFKKHWKRAAAHTLNSNPDISQAQHDAAVEAIDALTPHQLSFVQKFANKYHDLRQSSLETFIKDFEAHEGRTSPFAVLDGVVRDPEGKPTGRFLPAGEGEFVERFQSEKAAKEYIERRAKRIRNKLHPDALLMLDRGATPTSAATAEEMTGLRVLPGIKPTQGEIEARMGKTLSAYLTHLNQEGIENGFNLDFLHEAFPHLQPEALIGELRKLSQVSGNKPYMHAGTAYTKPRDAYEAVFGALTDSEFRDLSKRSAVAAAKGAGASKEMILRGIPRRIFVRFYKDRLANTAYDTDIIRAFSAYAPAVLRDIHYTPIMRQMADALETATQTGTNPGMLREYSSLIDDHLGRDRSFEPNIGRALGWLTSLSYNGILWARPGPAARNLIGQIMLVGLPEMGEDTALAALAAVADPSVRAALSQHKIIQHAIPLGERTIFDALSKVREAQTPRELRGAIKDTIGSSLNFMALSEAVIRSWAFTGGMIEHFKKLNPGMRAFDPRSPGSLTHLKQMLKTFDQLPEPLVEDALKAGEDMVRRVAFFFESSNMPRLFRTAKRFPLMAPFLQFTNFPINYANRFMTVLADAFDRRLSPAVRRANQGKIIRHLGMVFAIGGPMALPLIHEIVNDASSLDPGLGGRLRRFLEPYQAHWQQVNFNRDMGWTSTFAPMSDLMTPERFQTAPIPRALATSVAATGPRFLEDMLGMHPLLSEETQRARQRTFGAFTPYLPAGMSAPAPDNQTVPELAMTFLPGGSALEDYFRTVGAADRAAQGIPGPLDLRGRPMRMEDNPLARMTIGPSESDRADRADRKYLADKERSDQLVTTQFLRGLLSPDVTQRERQNATALFIDEPALITRINASAIREYLKTSRMTALERRIAGLSREQKLRVRIQLVQDLINADQMASEERERKLRALMVATGAE